MGPKARLNLALRKVAPADCENVALGGTLAGIDHAQWRDWGAAQATGTGNYVDGLGFDHPARFTVFRLRSHRGLTYYTRMHVVSKSVVRAGTRRPGIDMTVDVAPDGVPAARP